MNYDVTSTTSSGPYLITLLVLMIFYLFCMWKIFTKAGEKGWKAIIPIYNKIVLLKMTDLPTWYIILILIVPIANIYATFRLYIELAHKFGKSTGYGVATVFFPYVCIPILALGSATYNN